MKIAVDVSQLVYQGTGIATYTSRLIDNLLKIDSRNDFVLFGSSLRQRQILSDLISGWQQHHHVIAKLYPFPPLFLETLWNRLHVLPIDRLIGKVDVFHSSDWLQPPTSAAKVTTVHDLIVYRFPESFSSRGGHDIVANQKNRLRWVKKECALIMADSKATRQDLIDYLGIEPRRIKVIYLAAADIFKPQNQAAINKVKAKYRLDGDYLFCLGALEPRKNFKGAVEAFRLLGKTAASCQLVIAGKFAWGDNQLSNFKYQKSKIKTLGLVPQEDLPALYSGASCFVYPSFYEGFGLPVLEAMSCACPVVTTNRGSLPEITADSAQMVDPDSPEDIAAGIKRILKLSPSQRRQVVINCVKQAGRFNWSETARQVLSVYREVVE